VFNCDFFFCSIAGTGRHGGALRRAGRGRAVAIAVEQPRDGGGMRGQVKGWCPGALRPMETGDGLVVRVRPHGSRLTAAQALALADLAQDYGSGLIDLGTRAHLQLRGMRADSLSALHAALSDLGLLDPDAQAEARRNILTTPCWQDEETLRLVAALETALA